MSEIEAIVLGVVQGLTEFLPISSSAHLRVIPAFLGWQDPGAAYTAVIQLGSVLAVITYFWKDMMQLATGSIAAIKAKDYGRHELRMSGGIILGTIPICVLGLAVKNLLEQENSPLRALNVVGIASIVMVLLLLLAERLSKRNRTLEQIGAQDGLLVGLGQACALIPGCSRSGSTLTVAMFLNLAREDAARFSFLLGIPAITLSGLLELKHFISDGIDQAGVTSLVVGFLVAAVVSYIAIAWLLRYLKHHSTIIFVAYRILFGIATLALWAHGGGTGTGTGG
jgi:undecaprenyl-diphosphatase